MTRLSVDYAEHQTPTRLFEGHDPDEPVAGYYRTRLRSGAVYVGIHIWFGPPHDPTTGDEMDRSHRWQAEANGQMIEMERVWPKCAGDPIGVAEHQYLVAQQRWGEVNAPESPQANPNQRINPLTAPTPF